MTCPIPERLLVDYWADDLPADEVDAVDEHVLGCARCFEASMVVAALVEGLATALPPIALAHEVARERARGVRAITTDIHPGRPQPVVFHPDTDLLVHRLRTDLTQAESVSVRLMTTDGTTLLAFRDAPFERGADAVLLTCRPHYMALFPPDLWVELRRRDAGGREAVETYSIPHSMAE